MRATSGRPATRGHPGHGHGRTGRGNGRRRIRAEINRRGEVVGIAAGRPGACEPAPPTLPILRRRRSSPALLDYHAIRPVVEYAAMQLIDIH